MKLKLGNAVRAAVADYNIPENVRLCLAVFTILPSFGGYCLSAPLTYKNTPCSIEHGAFIAWLVAVFYGVFGAIRMPANPHKYWVFESLLAFFDGGLWCYQQKREKKNKLGPVGATNNLRVLAAKTKFV